MVHQQHLVPPQLAVLSLHIVVVALQFSQLAAGCGGVELGAGGQLFLLC